MCEHIRAQQIDAESLEGVALLAKGEHAGRLGLLSKQNESVLQIIKRRQAAVRTCVVRGWKQEHIRLSFMLED